MTHFVTRSTNRPNFKTPSAKSVALIAALFIAPITMTNTASAEPEYAKAGSGHDVKGPIAYRVVNVGGSETLNLRAWPSHRSRVLKRIRFNGRRLFNEGRKVRNWIMVSYKGTEGWVHKNYVAPENYGRSLYSVTGVRSYDDLNIRRRPSSSSFIVGAVPADGQGIRARGKCEDGFCPVKYGVMKGWVKQKHVEVQAEGRAHRSTWAERRAYNLRRFARWTYNFRERFAGGSY